MFLAIEAGLAFLALVLAVTVPNLGSCWLQAIERTFGRLAKRRGLSVVVVGLTSLALRAALLPILPIPQPLTHDEFSYLLGADTFAHGRLTNPTPPLWTHFESQMIILKPTYNSKYPPAQSLFLAVGQVLMGHPFWGVWLSVGLMCAAICWMLQDWIGEGWALLGGFLVLIPIGTFSHWGDSYEGGAVAALGGALVLGALPRLKQKHRVRNALLMGLGLAILANSRPYEGLVLSLPVAVALFAWMLGRHRPPFSVSMPQVVLPLCLVMGLTAAWMGYYNWRVAGNPLELPYEVSAAEYDPTPHFLWESAKPLPNYRHQEMKEWEVYTALDRFKATRSPAGLAADELRKVDLIWLYYFGPVLTLPLVLAFLTLPYGFSWKDISAPSRFLLLASAVSLAGLGVEVFFYNHYAAPMTCLFFALVLLAMRRLRQWRVSGKPSGLFLVRSVPTLTLLLLLLRLNAIPLGFPKDFGRWMSWFSNGEGRSLVGRSHIVSELRQQAGRQLVLVRYSRGLFDLKLHKTGIWPPSGVYDWVYNGADIEDQRVIWADDMSPAQNEKLIHYFKHRHVWLLYADDQPPKLVLYSKAVDNVTQAASGKMSLTSKQRR